METRLQVENMKLKLQDSDTVSRVHHWRIQGGVLGVSFEKRKACARSCAGCMGCMPTSANMPEALQRYMTVVRSTSSCRRLRETER